MLCPCRYDFAEWLSSRMMMQLSNEAGQSQVRTTLGRVMPPASPPAAASLEVAFWHTGYHGGGFTFCLARLSDYLSICLPICLPR
jgi:hypothetical protein